jgi:TrmH RNA methyltransferase
VSEREPEQTERVHGRHAALAVFDRRPDDVRRAWVTEEAAADLGIMLKALAERRRPYHVVTSEEVRKVSGAQHHEGVCIEALEPPRARFDDVLDALDREGGPARLLYLDNVQNPHNVGAILRTAAHFGAHAVLGARDELPSVRGAARRVARGGSEHVPIIALNRPARAIAALVDRGVEPLSTSVRRGQDLHRSELPRRVLYLLGAEGSGLSREVAALASRTVTIPGTGAVESLNVAAATAVLLAEHFRQHP